MTESRSMNNIGPIIYMVTAMCDSPRCKLMWYSTLLSHCSQNSFAKKQTRIEWQQQIKDSEDYSNKIKGDIKQNNKKSISPHKYNRTKKRRHKAKDNHSRKKSIIGQHKTIVRLFVCDVSNCTRQCIEHPDTKTI